MHSHTPGSEQWNQAGHPTHVGTSQILVNGKTVLVQGRELSGLQIKQVAMAQGVRIQADFVLFEDLSNGKQVVVQDEQILRVHGYERFEAITNDDNS